jgi:hypothetical protein
MIIAALMTTWCLVTDLHDRRSWTCVYDRQQCEGIVRLRRAGVCLPDSQKLWR